eukprot:COSAG01_NODE_1191_length_11314_cov_59.567722_13_plen_252_part_00
MGAALVPAAGQPGATDGTKLPSRYGGLTAAGRTQHWAPLDAAPGVRLTPPPAAHDPDLTDISLRFYIFALPLSPPAPAAGCHRDPPFPSAWLRDIQRLSGGTDNRPAQLTIAPLNGQHTKVVSGLECILVPTTDARKLPQIAGAGGGGDDIVKASLTPRALVSRLISTDSWFKRGELQTRARASMRCDAARTRSLPAQPASPLLPAQPKMAATARCGVPPHRGRGRSRPAWAAAACWPEPDAPPCRPAAIR